MQIHVGKRGTDASFSVWSNQKNCDTFNMNPFGSERAVGKGQNINIPGEGQGVNSAGRVVVVQE